MSQTEIVNRLRSGRFFSVEFIKRTDGKVRKLHGRCGVRKYLNGNGAPFSFKDNNLIPVFDLKLREYRSIPIENIIKINNQLI